MHKIKVRLLNNVTGFPGKYWFEYNRQHYIFLETARSGRPDHLRCDRYDVTMSPDVPSEVLFCAPSPEAARLKLVNYLNFKFGTKRFF